MSKRTIFGMGCVYLLGDTDKANYYKIGASRGSAEDRIKKLQTGNAGEIFLVKSYETKHPFFTEARLHSIFSYKKIINEWFELNDEDVKNFTKHCENIDKMVNSLDENPFFPKNLK